MLFVLLSLSGFAFEGIFPSTSRAAVNGYIDHAYGVALQLNESFVGTTVWYLLLIFSLRYFQIAVFVERQHRYIHGLEEKLNTKLGEELITRENKSYLDKYPVFSDWMWLIYTAIFPLVLVTVGAVKIVVEMMASQISVHSFTLELDGLAALLLSISTFIYLFTIHKK
jgi:hypothetical protein